jgi:hypothetical protein
MSQGFLKQMKVTTSVCEGPPCALYEKDPFLVFLKWVGSESDPDLWKVAIFRESNRRDFTVRSDSLAGVKAFAEQALSREFPYFFLPPSALERVTGIDYGL